MNAFTIPVFLPPTKPKRIREAYAREDEKPKATKPAPKGDPVPPMARDWRKGEYKPPLAMRIALERALDSQPALRAMTGGEAEGMTRIWPL